MLINALLFIDMGHSVSWFLKCFLLDMLYIYAIYIVVVY